MLSQDLKMNEDDEELEDDEDIDSEEAEEALLDYRERVRDLKRSNVCWY